MTRKPLLRIALLATLALATGCPKDDGNPGNPCEPQCQGRGCGDDGCGGSCGECEAGLACEAESGTCVECQPACDGRECGDDGCGGSCGTCADGQNCNPYTLRCVGGCVGDCTDKACGDDGCGASCGECAANQDCFAGQCTAKASCTDGKKNGVEGDTDCGGVCPDRCPVGATCNDGNDCTSGLCPDGSCQADVTCENAELDPGETDTDCGGPKCPRCAVGRYCKDHQDCLSLACTFGVCKEPSCDDGSKNQGESDVDCGGPCGKCENGRTCFEKGDCLAGGCDGGTCCTANACGECSDSPDEVCDGKDNDCDGQTDETPQIGEGDLCPKQQGVCQGSRARCAGGGWKCDAQAYRDANWAYQATESDCDGQDNDCNGQTDEPPQCCVPRCDGKDCGDDGCGGQCGTCDADRYCWVDRCYAKGAVRWHYKVEGYTITTHPVVDADGRIFLTTDFPFTLVVVDSGGQKVKSITAAKDTSYSSLHLAPGGLVLARTPAGTQAFDASLVSQWTSPFSSGEIAIGPGGKYVGTYLDGENRLSVAGFDPTGTTWSTPLGQDPLSWFYTQPAIAADGSIYVGGGDGNLYKLSSAGKVLWSRPVSGSLNGTAPAIGADGTVYLGTGKNLDSNGKSLYAFSPTGTQKWKFDADGTCATWPVVGPDGTIHVVDETRLYAITPAGELKWKVPLGDSTYNSPAVTRDGIVVVPTYSGIQAFDPAGNELWSFQKSVDSPVVLTPEGLALFNENTGSGSEIWALEVDSPPGSPWPMNGHDPRRSFQQTDALGTPPY